MSCKKGPLELFTTKVPKGQLASNIPYASLPPRYIQPFFKSMFRFRNILLRKKIAAIKAFCHGKPGYTRPQHIPWVVNNCWVSSPS